VWSGGLTRAILAELLGQVADLGAPGRCTDRSMTQLLLVYDVGWGFVD
jgi:hypothetical protein